MKKITKEAVLKVLRKVDEPEMGMNIVDLGLIYGVKIGKGIEIEMTVPCPGCFISQMIVDSVVQTVKKELKETPKVKLVFDPPWTPEKMSKAGKKKFGLK